MAVSFYLNILLTLCSCVFLPEFCTNLQCGSVACGYWGTGVSAGSTDRLCVCVCVCVCECVCV